MADFKFSCPHCQQSLEAPPDMAGETIECPTCKNSFCIPGNVPQPTQKAKKQLFINKPPSVRPSSIPDTSKVSTQYGSNLHAPPMSAATMPCPMCGETILAIAKKCKHCGEILVDQSAITQSIRPQSKPNPGNPICQQCGGQMKKDVVSSGNCAGIVLALIAFCAGILIACLIPVVGWVLGPLICIGALFMGGKRSKVWKCTACGTIVNRA